MRRVKWKKIGKGKICETGETTSTVNDKGVELFKKRVCQCTERGNETGPETTLQWR